MNDITWSKREKQIARRAFDRAYQGECAELLAKVREMAGAAQGPHDLWQIHDFLDDKRREIDEKYDYRGSVLVLVLGRLAHEGRVALEDLDGLGEDKLARIRTLVDLGRRASEPDEPQEEASAGDGDA